MYSATGSAGTGLFGVSRTPAIVSLVHDLQKIVLALVDRVGRVAHISR